MTKRIAVLLSLFAALAFAQNPSLRDYSCSDVGSTDTYACNLTVAPANYAAIQGKPVRFLANTANTGAATLNLNSLGAIAIKKVGGGVTTALDDNDIRAGQWVTLVYDGTNFQMQSQLGNSVTAPTDATIVTTDITTNNVSTSKHGWAPKLPGDSTKFLDGTGAYSVPPGTGGGGGINPWNPTTSGFTEDFLITTSGTSYGATVHTFTSDTGSFTRTDMAAGTTTPETHPGVIKVDIPTTANPRGRFVLSAQTTRSTFRLNTNEWHHTCVVYLSHANDIVDCRLGADSASPGTHTLGFRYDPSQGDAQFTAYMYATGSAITAAVSGSFATGWHQLDIYRVASGVGGNPTVYAALDEGTPVTFCSSGCTALLTQIPTISVAPQIVVGYNGTAGAGVTMELDFHAMWIQNATRHQ